MQFISISQALFGDFTRNGLNTCNLIRRIQCILECRSYQTIFFVQLSSKINFNQIIGICMKKEMQNYTFNDLCR